MRSEQERRLPPVAWPPPPPPPRRGGLSRGVRRALTAAVAGSVVLGAAWMLLPLQRGGGVRPVPGPVARAQEAVGLGAPVALPDLAALIGDREAHLRRHPGDQQSWAVLGSAYVEQGLRTADAALYPKAEWALRTSLAAQPVRNLEAMTGMAALADARGDFPTARKWGEQALKLAPKRWTTYPALIDAYSRLGDYDAARGALEKLMKLRAGTSGMMTAARVYRDRGWREDAAALLADAAARAGSPAERAAALEQAGNLAWERGEPGEALRWYTAAQGADPDRHAALAGAGRALAALGRTSDALRAYQHAMLKQPRPEYALELGELYESLRLSGAAKAQYDVVRARVKADATGGVNDELVLGRFEADHGDPQEAVRILRAEFARAGSTEAADALGWALHQTGENEEALTYARKATVKGVARSALFSYHRAEIERELDDDGMARRHLMDALRLNPAFSPLLAPRAREALASLGDPPPGGPAEVDGPAEPTAPAVPPTGPPQQPSPAPSATG